MRFYSFFSLLLPLPAQCVLASSFPIVARRILDIDATPQAFLANPSAHSVSASVLKSSASPSENTPAPLVMAYFVDWAGEDFPPWNINFALFDWIDFAFATPNEHFDLDWDTESSANALHALVTAAHNAGTKVKLSIGGWTGSKYFSPAVATEESRRTFISNIETVYKDYSLDGIDIDWEYPGREGASGNRVDPHDSNNFLSFLQALRNVLPPDARITAAAQAVPFTGPSGQPLEDASDFAKVLDWILIMNYDVWGSSGAPGPNAPLSDSCGNSTQPEANAVAGYNAWTSVGFPPRKLVLGLPSYGYVSKSDTSHLRQRSELGARHTRSKPSYRKARESTVEVITEDGEDQVQFRELISKGALTFIASSDKHELPTYEGSGGFTKHWDSCSSTPFLRSSSAGQIIAYDDPKSLAIKTEFVRKVGMLGVNVFDTHGDTDEWHLVDTIKKAAMGFYNFGSTETD